MKARVVLLVKILAAACAAAVTLALSLYTAGIWAPSKDRLLWYLVAAAGVSLVAAATSATREYLVPRQEGRRETVGELVRIGFWQVWRHSKVAPEGLGIAAYELRRRKMCFPPFAKKKLVRMHRERARNRRNTSGIKWRPGKGVIGLSVERGQFIGFDVAANWRDLHDCSEEEWNDQDDEVRQGLTYEEFKKLRGKHGVVVAHPILGDAGNVLGCVAVDGPDGSAARLESKKVQEGIGRYGKLDLPRRSASPALKIGAWGYASCTIEERS